MPLLPLEAFRLIMTISGLINTLVGIFLLARSTKGLTLGQLLFSDIFPIFIAALLFLANGLGLFVEGACRYLSGGEAYVWYILYEHFYTFTYALIILFVLYYPRPLHRALERPSVKLGIMFILFVVTMALVVSTMLDKAYWFLSYPSLGIKTEVWLRLKFLYHLAINLAMIVFAGWYMFGSLSERERDCMALLIIGFIFGPINRSRWIIAQGDLIHENMLLRDYIQPMEIITACIVGIVLVMFCAYVWASGRRRVKRELLVMAGIAFSFGTLILFFPVGELYDQTFYKLGFALVRPICFIVAILKFKLFNIDVERKVVLYTTITLAIGFLFFQFKNLFQAFIPGLGFLAIVVVSVLFLPMSALSRYLADRITPHVHQAMSLLRTGGGIEQGVAEESPLASYFTEMMVLRKLIFVIVLGLMIEVLENGLTAIIPFPTAVSVVFIGILFSALDYLVDVQFSGEGGVQKPMTGG